MASRCISRSMERGMSRHGACRVAASVLTKVALERGSRDNITVIVVDITLQPTRNDEEGNCQSHVVPSSYPEGSINEGDESEGAGAGKVMNPNNFSVGTHFLIKSRPSSEGGDAGGGRKHSAGDSMQGAFSTRCGCCLQLVVSQNGLDMSRNSWWQLVCVTFLSGSQCTQSYLRIKPTTESRSLQYLVSP